MRNVDIHSLPLLRLPLIFVKKFYYYKSYQLTNRETKTKIKLTEQKQKVII